MKPRLTVLGSLNIDVVVKCRKRPRPGETVMGEYHALVPGGKGANQACAGSLLGGEVSIIGCIGEDQLGEMLLESLAKNGIDTSALHVLPRTPTGAAFITIDDRGENSIIVSGGANRKVTPDIVDPDVIKAADIVLVQLETPLESVERAFEIAVSGGRKTVLNPSPVRTIPDSSVLWKSTVFVMNEIEAEYYSGIPVHVPSDALEAGRAVLSRGVEFAVVTLGEQGSVVVSNTLQETVKAFAVDAVDTTAAGDTYIGGFCTEWLRTGDVVSAMRYGSAAAAISVTRFGAQTSIPADIEVRRFLKDSGG